VQNFVHTVQQSGEMRIKISVSVRNDSDAHKAEETADRSQEAE
jgi:hypothetical protein